MKLLILGATGPTGRHVVDGALRAGDDVTVLVRDPAAMRELADRLTVVGGDATSRADLDGVVAGQDAVVSALGAAKSLRTSLFSEAAPQVVGAAEAAGVRRLVWLSSFGVGASLRRASVVQSLLYRTMLRAIYADKAVAEERIRASSLDWTFVYPTGLTHRAASGAYTVSDDVPMRGMPTVSRADVAAFMLRAARDDEWVHRTAVITD